ncbi:MAG: hypothetical protein HQ462_00500 [Deltaproteobacteria bacterium]|nr:hypothetical protein [Deltaproteobacteria bacterium]
MKNRLQTYGIYQILFLALTSLTLQAGPPITRPITKPLPKSKPLIPGQKPPSPQEIRKPLEERKKPVHEDTGKALSESNKKETTRTNTESYEATKARLKDDPIIKELLKREKIDIETDAFKGILTMHQAFDSRLSKTSSHKTAGIFEKNLAERLVGKDEIKNLKEAEIKDLQALTCASQCGHPNFYLSCRRITRFLAAAGTLTAAGSLGTLFYNFMTAEAKDDAKTITVNGLNSEPLTIYKLGDDTPADEELVTQVAASK